MLLLEADAVCWASTSTCTKNYDSEEDVKCGNSDLQSVDKVFTTTDSSTGVMESYVSLARHFTTLG